MADTADKTKPKRLSKSERTHRRRLKQAAHKPAAAGSQPTSAMHPATMPKQEK